MLWKMSKHRPLLTLDIELTTNCNARCPQCSRTDELNRCSKKDWLPLIQVSIEQFKSWFPPKDMQHIHIFHFSGTYGDPGMCKDLYDIVEYIIFNSKSIVSINTNGSMRSEDFWFQLGALGRDRLRIMFDVDGIDQEMHSFYRRGTNLQKVLDNIESICQTPAIVSVLTVMFKHNQDYVEQIQDMCRELGVTRFDTVEGNNFTEGPEFNFISENNIPQVLEQVTRPDREQGLERIDRRVRDYRHIDIVEDYESIECLAAKDNNIRISASGLVSPCCYLSTSIEKISEFGRQTKQTPDKSITTNGNDEINPLMEEYIDRRQDFNINNRSIVDILKDVWYTEKLEESFSSPKLCSYACKRVCGKK